MSLTQETKAYKKLIDLGVDADTAEILAMNTDASLDQVPDARFLPISASGIPASIRAAYDKQIAMNEDDTKMKSGNDQAVLTKNERLQVLLAVATTHFSQKLAIIEDSMIFFGENNQILIEGVTTENFASYLAKIFGRKMIGNKSESILTTNESVKFTKSLLANLIRSSENHIQQYGDFYILEGKPFKGNLLASDGHVINGQFKSTSGLVPRHNVKYGCYEAIEDPDKYLQAPKLLRALTMNMANDSEEDAFYLEKLIATAIFNDLYTKSKVKTMLVISGVSGAGKSHLLRYLQKVFTADYGTTTVSINQLANEFKRAEVTKTAFILTDGDMPASTIKDEASEYLKNASGGDIITAQVKNKQREYSDYFAGLIMIVSNFATTFTDKSEAITNRLAIFNPKSQLNIDEDVFDLINSDEEIEAAANYFLAIYSKMLNKEISLPSKDNRTTEVKKNLQSFRSTNDSTVAFAESFGIENLINMPTSEVKRIYEDFCEENNLVPMKRQFTNTLSESYSLKAKLSRLKYEDYLRIEEILELAGLSLSEAVEAKKLARERFEIAGSISKKDKTLAEKPIRCFVKK